MAANAHLGLTIFSGRFRGNARYQRGHSALFSGYSLPEHICKESLANFKKFELVILV